MRPCAQRPHSRRFGVQGEERWGQAGRCCPASCGELPEGHACQGGQPGEDLIVEVPSGQTQQNAED